MKRNRSPLFILAIVFIGLVLILRSDLKNSISLRLEKCSPKIIPLEEIKAQERERRIAPFLNDQIRPDDPELIKVLQECFLDPPSMLLPKMSNRFIQTPQAKQIDLILNKKKGGFFIECGAFDGERASNSIFFEKKLGWTGVLIEMDPSFYMQIQGKNRNAYSLNVCLSPHQYPIKMTFKEVGNGQGKLIRNDDSKKPIHTRNSYCLPLYSIMLALNQTQIDYFSLDVEGFELEILKTIPFDKLDITTLSVEFEHAPNGGREYSQFMDQHGYHKNCTVKRDLVTYAYDYIFVKRSYLTSHNNPV